jgi:hypothetical protein
MDIIPPPFWTYKQVQKWIDSLDNGKYVKYSKYFKNINGILLRYMTSMELNHRIIDEKDRQDFEAHLRVLFPVKNRKILFPTYSQAQLIESMTSPVVEINCDYDI